MVARAQSTGKSLSTAWTHSSNWLQCEWQSRLQQQPFKAVTLLLALLHAVPQLETAAPLSCGAALTNTVVLLYQQCWTPIAASLSYHPSHLIIISVAHILTNMTSCQAQHCHRHTYPAIRHAIDTYPCSGLPIHQCCAIVHNHQLAYNQLRCMLCYCAVPAAPMRNVNGSRSIVMRPLGTPSAPINPQSASSNGNNSSNGRTSSPSNGNGRTSSPNGNKFNAESRSNGSTSTSYNNDMSNGASSNGATGQQGLVLARRPVSALTAVQTAAAGAAGSLTSRERVAAYVADNSQVRLSFGILFQRLVVCLVAMLVY